MATKTKTKIVRKPSKDLQRGDTVLVTEVQPWKEGDPAYLYPGDRKTLDMHAQVLDVTYATVRSAGARRAQGRYAVTTTVGVVKDIAPVHRWSTVVPA